jgi:hypothetical protein
MFLAALAAPLKPIRVLFLPAQDHKTYFCHFFEQSF